MPVNHICTKDCICVNSGLPLASVKIDNVACKVMVDTGSVANILDEQLYNKLGKPQLKSGKKRLCPYRSAKPLKVLGTCSLTVETKKIIQVHDFQVVSGNYGALLGYNSATELGLVKVNLNSIQGAGEHEKLRKVLLGV